MMRIPYKRQGLPVYDRWGKQWGSVYLRDQKIPILVPRVRNRGTENERVCREMLGGLLDRELKIEPGLLCVIDGSKGLRKAVYEVFGMKALIQRCQWHDLKDCSRRLWNNGGLE